MGKVRGQFNVGFTDKQNGMGKEEAFSSILFMSLSLRRPSEQLNWSMNPKKRRKSEIDWSNRRSETSKKSAFQLCEYKEEKNPIPLERKVGRIYSDQLHYDIQRLKKKKVLYRTIHARQFGLKRTQGEILPFFWKSRKASVSEVLKEKSEKEHFPPGQSNSRKRLSCHVVGAFQPSRKRIELPPLTLSFLYRHGGVLDSYEGENKPWSHQTMFPMMPIRSHTTCLLMTWWSSRKPAPC